MTEHINVFPKRLTILSLVFLFFVLVVGVFFQFRIAQNINSFQSNDIPTLQLAGSATRVISETELLLTYGQSGSGQIKIREQVLEDTLSELVYLTKEFPEVSQKFAQSPHYLKFQSHLNGEQVIEDRLALYGLLKGDVQTLVEEYLFKKTQLTREHIFYGWLSTVIGILGVLLFFLLTYAIYKRYQINLESLEQMTSKLESERLISIQSAKLASLGEMAAGLAHEINNPLSVIIGRAEIIMEQIKEGNASDTEVLKAIGKINEMAFRISRIIVSMRKISKGSDTSEVDTLNIGSVLEDILNLSGARMKTSQVELDISGVDNQLSVMGNFTHLSQVLINLINNSIDELLKIPEDERKIWIKTEDHHGVVHIKVIDNGPGVPPEVRGKLFQPFFTTKEVGKGTGLGLSISKTLMQEMGGELELSEDMGRTCFVLKFFKG